MHQTYAYTITTLLAQIGTLENAFRIDIDIVGVVPVAYVPNADQKVFMAACKRVSRSISHRFCADAKLSLMMPGNRERQYSVTDRPVHTAPRHKRESQEDYLRLANFVMKRVSEAQP